MPKKDLSGQRFGMLTVIEDTGKIQDRYVLWHCKCDCGEECFVNTKQLKRGTVTNCGCIPKTTARNGTIAENLTGQHFGKLTVLYRGDNSNHRTCWVCRCFCGNLCNVTAHDLKSGHIKSCGCNQHRTLMGIRDLTGQRFGRLTVLAPTSRRDKKGSVFWKCRCECGSELEVTEDSLIHGNYKSCGCRRREIRQNIPNQLTRIDGTCIEILEKRKYRSDNTSGYRGVYRTTSGKFRVSIGFKGKRYYLGIYEKFVEAVEARKEAEERIHDGFVRAYRIWKEREKEDPEWAKENPLIFEVVNDKENLYVYTNISE